MQRLVLSLKTLVLMTPHQHEARLLQPFLAQTNSLRKLPFKTRLNADKFPWWRALSATRGDVQHSRALHCRLYPTTALSRCACRNWCRDKISFAEFKPIGSLSNAADTDSIGLLPEKLLSQVGESFCNSQGHSAHDTLVHHFRTLYSFRVCLLQVIWYCRISIESHVSCVSSNEL